MSDSGLLNDMSERVDAGLLLAIALAAVVIDVGLTRLIVGTAQATEIAPGSSFLIERTGWLSWAAVYLLTVRAGFAVAGLLDADLPRVATASRFGITLLPLAVTGANLGGLALVGGWPETAPWVEIATVTLVAAAGAGVAFAPRRLVATTRQRAPSARTVATVAAVGFVVAGGLPLGTISATQPASADSVATTSYSTDFSNVAIGNKPSGWDTSTVQQAPNGDKGLEIPEDSGDNYYSPATIDHTDFTVKSTYHVTTDGVGAALYLDSGSEPLGVNIRPLNDRIEIVAPSGIIRMDSPVPTGEYDIRLASDGGGQVKVEIKGPNTSITKTVSNYNSDYSFRITDFNGAGTSAYLTSAKISNYQPPTTNGKVEYTDGSPAAGAAIVQDGEVLGYTDENGQYAIAEGTTGQITAHDGGADEPESAQAGETITVERAPVDGDHDTLNIHYWEVDETDENGEPLGWDVYGAPGAKLEFEIVEGPETGRTWTRYADKDLDGNYTSVASFEAPPSGLMKVTSTYGGETKEHFISLKPGGRLMGIRLGNPKPFVSFGESQEYLNESQVETFGDQGANVVSGTVTDSAGDPVANATVAAPAGSQYHATTAADGSYSIPIASEESGSTVVSAAKAGYDRGQESITLDGSKTVDLQLSEISGTNGSVLTGYREPAPGAQVTAREPGSIEVVDATVADADGRYTLDLAGRVGSDVVIEASRGDLSDDSTTTDPSTGDPPIPNLYLLDESERAASRFSEEKNDPLTHNNVDSLNVSSIRECDPANQISRTTEAGLNLLTGGLSGAVDTLGVYEFGPSACQPDTEAQRRLTLLVSSISINQTEQTTRAVLSNYLTDTRSIAYSEGKISAYNTLADGSIAAQAKADANASVDGYYYSNEANIASAFSTAAVQAEYIYEQEFDTTSETGDWVHPAQNGQTVEFASDPWVEAEVELSQETVDMQTYRLASGDVVTPYPDRTTAPGGGPYVSNAALRVEGPPETGVDVDGGAYTVVANSDSYGAVVEGIGQQREQVKANLAVVIEETAAEYESANLTVDDFLTPTEISSRAATDYNETGYYSFAAVDLAAQGLAGNVNQSHTITLGSGEQITGTLFYSGDESLTLEQGRQYQPVEYDGEFILAANKDDGGVQQLDGPFEITEQYNTQTGEPVETAQTEQYVYNSTNTSQLQQEIEQLQQLSEQYGETQQNSGVSIDLPGDGGLIDRLLDALGLGPNTPLLIGVGLILFLGLLLVVAIVT